MNLIPTYKFDSQGQPRHTIRWVNRKWESYFMIWPSWALYTFVVWVPAYITIRRLELRYRDPLLPKFRRAHLAVLGCFTTYNTASAYYEVDT